MADTASNVFGTVGSFESLDADGTMQGLANTTQDLFAPIGGMFQGLANSFGLINNFKAGHGDYANGTTAGQLNANYANAQNALAQQQAFANALGAQGGIGNQASVFNQQQGLANQLQGVANGTGPNPALAQLNQTTANNVAAQNALMAGQRGSNANVGLMARQAAMQGADTQQQAVGQAATMQANQQLAGMNALSNQQANMANLANSQIGNQAQAVNSLNSAAQNEQQILQNVNSQYNNANVNMQSNMNSVNNSAAQGNQNEMNQIVGGLMGGGALAGMMAHGGMVKKRNYYADGGEVDDGGQQAPSQIMGPPAPAEVMGPPSPAQDPSMMGPPAPVASPAQQFEVQAPVQAITGRMDGLGAPNTQVQVTGPSSFVGKFLSGDSPNAQSSSGMAWNSNDPSMPAMPNPTVATGANPWKGDSAGGGGGGGGGMGALMALLNKGGAVKKPVVGEQLAAKGKMVPGKAKVKGDSLKNDVVPAKLSPGEIVIPRSIAQGPNAPRNAAAFVAAILAKNGMGKKI